jgi:hypothetical protein
MDVTEVFKRGFDLFIKDVLPLVVAALFLGVLTPLTLGILGGPLTAGLYRMVVRRVREDHTPQIGDVFYFERFGSFVGAFYVLTIAIAIGYFLLIIPGLYLSTIWFYVFPLMVDRGLGLTDAMGRSKALVDEIGIGPQFGLVLLLALVAVALSSVTRMIGSLAAAPFCIACAVVAYDIVTAKANELVEPPPAPQPDGQ